MELYEENLTHQLTEQYNEVVLAAMVENAREIIKMNCYQLLAEIKAIIKDLNLDDPECFAKIQEAVHALEAIGSSGGPKA